MKANCTHSEETKTKMRKSRTPELKATHSQFMVAWHAERRAHNESRDAELERLRYLMSLMQQAFVDTCMEQNIDTVSTG